jgi:hypothetical protein
MLNVRKLMLKATKARFANDQFLSGFASAFILAVFLRQRTWDFQDLSRRPTPRGMDPVQV